MRNGQVMIISVVMLGGILLSAAAIAGLLMVYQIRASNDAVNSAKAVFAADAGIEIVSWCFFKGCPPPYNTQNPPPIDFDDSGVYFEVDSDTTATDITITSKGFAAGGITIRTLETVFSTE